MRDDDREAEGETVTDAEADAMAEGLCDSADESVADTLAAADGLAFMVGAAEADGSLVVVAEGKLVADGDKDESEELNVDDEAEAEAEKELRAALCVPTGEVEEDCEGDAVDDGDGDRLCWALSDASGEPEDNGE